MERLPRRYLGVYRQAAEVDLTWDDFQEEIALSRALVALRQMRASVNAVVGPRGREELRTTGLGDGPRKWIILELAALKDFIVSQN